MKQYVILLTLVFALGWAGSNAYSTIYKENYELNLVNSTDSAHPILISKDRISPADRIKESQIHVYDDVVVIDIKDPEWSKFTDTNSMDPVIDSGANAIHVVPATAEELEIGDIVAYQSTFSQSTIIHRIIDIGQDTEGIYFILKGDNNPQPDPEKVRFDQIKRVLVAVIY